MIWTGVVGLASIQGAFIQYGDVKGMIEDLVPPL